MPDTKNKSDSAAESPPTAEELIECIEAYFASTDNFDVAATLRTMTPDCTLEYLSADIKHQGRDTGIRKYFEDRAQALASAWHGNFSHSVDTDQGRVATRFNVRRVENEGAMVERDNINLFQFEGRLISEICVWRGSPQELS